MAVMHFSHRVVMIVAPTGIWRDALVSLMRAQPNLLVSSVVDALPAARDLLSTTHIDVIVIDSSVGDADLTGFLRWLGSEHASVRIVVAVDTQLQQLQYLATGAHATLQKGRLNDALLRVAMGDGG
jgi:DNA-binding NarL/FixJ family response regulator